MKVKTVSDNPTDKAELLGHKEIGETLKNFIESEETITPLTIALDGDWGSGKTSIMKTLAKKIDINRFDTIFFEAWKYEYSNPALGLITTITERYEGGSQLARRIITAAASILTDKFLGVDLEKAVRVIRGTRDGADNINSGITNLLKEHLKNKKLIILIDDLDRCDVENSLQLLTVMKLFLDIQGVICLAGVNLSRLDQAWKFKYKAEQNETGRNYLEKIFQIKIGVHVPTPEHVKNYLKSLVEEIDDDSLDLFAGLAPKNPRAIKKLVNLISYRKILLKTSIYGETSAFLWTLFEEIGGSASKFLYEELKRIGKGIAEILSNYEDFDTFNKWITNQEHSQILSSVNNMRLKVFLDNASLIVEKKISNKEQLNIDFDALYNATLGTNN